MWIESIQIVNFKAFQDTGVISLARTMNIIVGKNNSGKTAFLEAIGLQLQPNAHRSLKFPREHVYDPKSSIELQLRSEVREFLPALLSYSGPGPIQIPIPPEWITEPVADRDVFEQFLSLETISFRLTYGAEHGAGIGWKPGKFPSHQLFQYEDGKPSYAVQVSVNSQKSGFSSVQRVSGISDNLGLIVGNYLGQKIYYFSAQRLNVGNYILDVLEARA